METEGKTEAAEGAFARHLSRVSAPLWQSAARGRGCCRRFCLPAKRLPLPPCPRDHAPACFDPSPSRRFLGGRAACRCSLRLMEAQSTCRCRCAVCCGSRAGRPSSHRCCRGGHRTRRFDRHGSSWLSGRKRYEHIADFFFKGRIYKMHSVYLTSILSSSTTRHFVANVHPLA